MDELLGPIKGEDLLSSLGSRQYPNLLFPNKVAGTIELALEKIKLFFKTEPTLDGNNIWGISEIRKELFMIADGYPSINAFIITAPHTHWDYGRPVIYKFDKENSRYIIGPHEIDRSDTYTPVSFVFSQDQLLPYEWADSSILLENNEFTNCIKTLVALNEKIFSFNLPLGVSIDFRFKSSLFDNLCSTVEYPADDKNNEFSYILKKNNAAQIEELLPFDQVGWHPVNDESLSLNSDEYKLLNDIRMNINSIGDLNALL